MSETATIEKPVYTKKDFSSGVEVRWCPGCGDYSILAAVQKALPEFEHLRENYAFISGIGCSSRFPYYMNTYGFHTIHGRAPAIATGLKIMRPELSVWVITGDGDGLSIGGNHFIHVLRRNVDINILLFNNEIYGLTKGQYSPTSNLGLKTKSTPYGAIDTPLIPARLAAGAGATFIARSADMLAKHLNETLHKANEHKGTSFVEVLQNCYIFNDGAFDPYLEKSVRDDRVIYLEAGKPMIFGKDKDKGIRLNHKTLTLEAVSLSEVAENEILIHDPYHNNTALHFMLASMGYGGDGLPLALGVIRSLQAPIYNDRLAEQETEVIAKKGKGRLTDLLKSGETWEVK